VLGFAPLPGYADERYRIDADGYRGEDLPSNLGERFTVLCVGDSTTFGWEVREGEHFPARLSDALRDRVDRSWVVNGGVPSYTSTQVLRKLERDLPALRPAIVIVTMPWNDAWYSAFSPWRAEILVPRMPGPSAMWLLRRSAAVRLVAGPRRPRPAVDRSAPEALEAFARNVSGIVALVRAAGAVPVLQTPPFDLDHVDPGGVRHDPVGLRWDAEFLIGTARRWVARFEAVATELDVSLVANPLSLGHARRLFLDEVHPTPAGYARMASAVLATLESEKLLPVPQP
jgi:lysophospholipase L1-like esterase